MRRIHQLICGVLIAAMTLLPATRPANAGAVEYVPNEVIVKLAPLANVVALAAALGLSVVPGTIDRLGDLPIYRLKILDGVLPPDKAAALMRLPLVLYAEPNYVGEVPEGVYEWSWSKGDGGEGNYQKQWAPTTIRLAEGQAIARGAGVTVAVLDTGVDPDHPALRGHLAPGYDFVDLDADPREEGVYGRDAAYGHGTHVAGIVALAAPQARIMPLRILKPNGAGDSWLLAQGIRYAAAQRAGVLNLSYTVKRRSLLIDDLLDMVGSALPGAVVAAAAGNSGGSGREYPAGDGAPGVLAVAASTRADRLASFSTYGAWVDVAAPGEQIVSSVPLASGSAYSAWSGTSMATPFVAATAALVRSANPSLGAAEVARRIVSASTSIDSPVPRRLDAAAALGLPQPVHSQK